MKKIEAIIQPQQVEAVMEGLAEVGIFRLTVQDARGLGPASDDAGETGLLRKVKLLIAVEDGQAEMTAKAVQGATGEGETRARVTVLPLEDVIRIRTGERGSEAL